MFAGIIVRNGSCDPRDLACPETLLRAITPYNQADKTGIWESERAILVGALTWNTDESLNEQVPTICKHSGRIIVSWIRLDNRSELCSKLGLRNQEKLTDPEIVLNAYENSGPDCVNSLEGDFSFTIYNPNTNTALCARDTIGALPYFYYIDEDVFIFASTAAIFSSLKNLKISISQKWLARYLVRCSPDRSETAFEEVFKLMPAQYLSVSSYGPTSPETYFSFNPSSPVSYHQDERWVQLYSESFENAVKTRTRSRYLIGAESSGGIDSSTIVARAIKHLPHPVEGFHCFGLSHMEQEPEYILATPAHCGIQQCHIITTPPYVLPASIEERTIRTIGYPEENGLAGLYYPFYEGCAQNKIRTLLSGFGGDEVVTSQASELYTELMQQHAYATMMRTLPGNFALRTSRTIRRLGSNVWQKKSTPIIPELRSMELELLDVDVARIFSITALTSRFYDRLADSVNKRALHLLTDQHEGGFRTSRLEACSLMAISYKVSYRWPMLDRRLIQQYLSTPSIEKRYRNMGRYLHRRACVGDVPDKVLWKPSKSLGRITQIDKQIAKTSQWLTDSLPTAITNLIDMEIYQSRCRMLEDHSNGKRHLSFQKKLVCIHNLHSVAKANLFLAKLGVT